jgi:hypothetical protein
VFFRVLNKTDRYDITEILLKVALNTIIATLCLCLCISEFLLDVNLT